MHVVIEGHTLPGRTFCDPDGLPLNDVRVGIQVRNEPTALFFGDSPTTRWEFDILVVVDGSGQTDFRGPAVQGKRGDRFIYLTWGNVTHEGHFAMFRRAKLMINRVDQQLIQEANVEHRSLVGTVRLSDALGAPRCARVDPPDLTWSLR